MFHVKICGITNESDARLAAEAGADAIGLNFVAGSPRQVEPTAARAVAAAVPGGVLKVGVFAGTPAEDIRRLVELVGLDAVQLHGHLFGDDPATDPPSRCVELAGLPVIRAIRMEAAAAGGDPLAAARRWIAMARSLGAAPALVIIDAAVALGTDPGRLGGTGATVDWAAHRLAAPQDVAMALAGGLTPENVAQAIRGSGAGAVDTASGVESVPGRKDPLKVRAFVAAARSALASSAKSG